MKVLIIEDERPVSTSWKRWVERFAPGSEVILAESCEEALTTFSSLSPFDLIVMDGNLKGTKTLELTSEIRKRYTGNMLAASGDDDLNRGLHGMGCNHVTRKMDARFHIVHLLNGTSCGCLVCERRLT